MPDAVWFLYLVRTRKDTLYTGITLDVTRRLEEHAGNRPNGAKYLRAMAPLQLAYSAPVGDKGTALLLEQRIKKLPKSRKEQIVQEQPDIQDLLHHFVPERG